MDYLTGKIISRGTSTGKILYPRAYMGNPSGRFFFDKYGYRMILSDMYVPVAILTPIALAQTGAKMNRAHVKLDPIITLYDRLV
jgi:hypothetical protein